MMTVDDNVVVAVDDDGEREKLNLGDFEKRDFGGDSVSARARSMSP
jgi:hypothetical protein